MSDFCKHCGTRLNGEAFCPKCQSQTAPAAPFPPPLAGEASPPPLPFAVADSPVPPAVVRSGRRMRLFAGIGAAVAVCAIVLAIVALFLDSKPTTGASEAAAPVRRTDAPLDMSWVLGFSLGDSAESLGFKFEGQNYPYSRLYRVPPDILPGLQKGWRVRVGSAPRSGRIYNISADWTPRHALDMDKMTNDEIEDALAVLRKKYRTTDDEHIAFLMAEDKYREVLEEMKKRFGMDPVEDVETIVQTLPTSLSDCFLTVRSVMDKGMFRHIHLFQKGNRCVYLVQFGHDEGVGIAVLDRDLLREAMLEARQIESE